MNQAANLGRTITMIVVISMVFVFLITGGILFAVFMR
jgi:hypothetical protein